MFRKWRFLFIHGTPTKEFAEDICKRGLESDYPELNYTAYMMEAEDRLLYDKLKSIIINKLYSQKHSHENMIEDTSFLPITGQFTQVSLPP